MEAIRESPLPNLAHGIGDRVVRCYSTRGVLQKGAFVVAEKNAVLTREQRAFALHVDGGEGVAPEGVRCDFLYGARQGDFGETVAFPEGVRTYFGYGIGDLDCG